MRTWMIIVIVVAVLTVLIVGGIAGSILLAQYTEAYNEIESKNHLKQFGLLVHNYHDEFGRFPEAFIPGEGEPSERPSWLVRTLHIFREQQLEADLMRVYSDESKRWNDPAAAKFTDKPFVFFQNPALAGNGPANLLDYAGVAGIGKNGPTMGVRESGRGAFS